MSEHAAGPMPVKSTTRLTIKWGIVSLPVKVYAGMDDGAAVKRNEFTTDGHPVGRMNLDKTTLQPYTGPVVKKAKVDAENYVDLTDEEIELVTGGVEKGLADIEVFVPLSSIGTTYKVTNVSQVRPNNDVNGSASPFALLCKAMAKHKVGALVRVALKSVAKYAIITPDGEFLQLAYCDQVRPPLDMPVAEHSDRELDMADSLIDAVGIDEPVLVNDTAIKVREYVEAKFAGSTPIVAVEIAAPANDGSSLEAMLAAAVEAARAEKAAPAEKPKAKAKAKKAA